MDPFKDFDRSREEIRELADQGREEAGEREPIPDEELDDEARAVRERLRAERREKKRRAARTIKTLYIVVLVALIAAMLWAFVGIGSRNGEVSAAEAEQTIQRFARAWYSDWEFEDGEQVAVDGDEVEDSSAATPSRPGPRARSTPTPSSPRRATPASRPASWPATAAPTPSR